MEPLAQLFYRCLMSVVDDFGRYYAKPAFLMSACFPQCPIWADELVLADWLTQCVKAGLVNTYSVSGTNYLEIINFGQRLRKDAKSKFPPCAESGGVQPICAADFGDSPSPAAESGSRAASPTPTPATTSNTSSDQEMPKLKILPAVVNGHTPTREELFAIDPRWLRAGFSGPEEFEGWFRAVYKAHPARGGLQVSQNTLLEFVMNGKATKSAFEAGYAAWRESREWKLDRGRYIPQLPKFCSDEGWAHPPIEPVEERGEF